MENPITNRARARAYYWNVIKKDKEKYKKYVLTTKKNVAEWRKRNPEKVKAQRAVFIALRNKTIKKKPCFCGNPKSEAHHENYSKPLKIIWLCKEHHRIADLKNKIK